MSVTRFVNCAEKFDTCSHADKWEWVSVNGSWIGLVGLLKLLLYVRFEKHKKQKLLHNSKQRHTFQFDEGHCARRPVELGVKV